MPSPHKQSGKTLQAKLDALQRNASVQLLPGEFAGPVVIKQPLVLDGRGATLWSLQGPVLVLQSEGIVLRNLKIEVTGAAQGRAEEGCAILSKVKRGFQFENVEVRGTVIGLANEEGIWHYPRSLHLGELASDHEHDFLMKLELPAPCRLVSKIAGLKVEPLNLNKGTNTVRLRLERQPPNTWLNGTLFLITPLLTRSFTLCAHVFSHQDGRLEPGHGNNQLIWDPEQGEIHDTSLEAEFELPEIAASSQQPAAPISTSTESPPPSSTPHEPVIPIYPQPPAVIPKPPAPPASGGPLPPRSSRFRQIQEPAQSTLFSQTIASEDAPASPSNASATDASSMPKLSNLFTRQNQETQAAQPEEGASAASADLKTSSNEKSSSEGSSSGQPSTLKKITTTSQHSQDDRIAPTGKSAAPDRKVVRGGGISSVFGDRGKSGHEDQEKKP